MEAKIAQEKMRQGITYAHEHTTIDLSRVKKDPDCRLDEYENTLTEFRELKKMGVTRIVDVTNRGMGRNIPYVQKMMADSGLKILAATGYYKEPFLPEEVYRLSVKELAAVMIGEIRRGIEDSGVKASVIGEIGTGKGAMSPLEVKVFQASARAHLETGRPLSTHTTLGTLGLEQLRLFKEAGVDLTKVYIGHVDLSHDLDYILRLLDTGANVGFDTIGKAKYAPDEERLDFLQAIADRGLCGQVLMSMDITRKSHLKAHGGLGYGYLLHDFVPRLRERGLSSENIQLMLVKNGQRLFSEEDAS